MGTQNSLTDSSVADKLLVPHVQICLFPLHLWWWS